MHREFSVRELLLLIVPVLLIGAFGWYLYLLPHDLGRELAGDWRAEDGSIVSFRVNGREVSVEGANLAKYASRGHIDSNDIISFQFSRSPLTAHYRVSFEGRDRMTLEFQEATSGPKMHRFTRSYKTRNDG